MFDMSFKLRPESILHAAIRIAELVKEISKSFEWTRAYTRVCSRVISKSLGDIASPAEPSELSEFLEDVRARTLLLEPGI